MLRPVYVPLRGEVNRPAAIPLEDRAE